MATKNVWGTQPPPTQLTRTGGSGESGGFEHSGGEGQEVTIENREYIRVGDAALDETYAGAFKPKYNEKWGYVVPKSVIAATSRAGNFLNTMGTYMPLAVMGGMFAGPVAASVAGAGGLGATLGAAAGTTGAELAAGTAAGLTGAGEAAALGTTAGINAGTAEGLGLDWGAIDSGQAVAPWSTDPSLGSLGGTPSTGFDPGLMGNDSLFSAADWSGQGGGTNPLTSTPPGSTSLLQRVLSGDASGSDYLDVLGKLGGTALGLAGSGAQTDAYADLQKQYLALGEGDRKRLDDSYKPGFNIWDQAGYGDLLKGVTDTQLRRLSANGGNPYGNPGGLTEMNKNITANVGIPALSGYRGQLLQGGGVGLSGATSAGLLEAGTARNPYDALAGGLGALTAPKDNSLEELLKKFSSNQQVKLGGGYTGGTV